MSYRVDDKTAVVAVGETAKEALQAMTEVLTDIAANIIGHADYDSADGWFSLNFEVGGELMDEATFFAQLPWDDSVEYTLEETFVSTLTEFHAAEGTVYTHEELETGTAAVEYLVTHQVFDLYMYADFLKAIDLDHTVEQMDVVERLIELHGRDEMDDILDYLDDEGGVLFELIVRPTVATSSTGFALHKAVSTDDLERVRALLADGHAVNKVDEDGRAALHHLSGAVSAATLEILDALIDAKADVNLQDGRGETELHSRCGRADWLPVVKRLLDAGADLQGRTSTKGKSYPNCGGRTPVFSAYNAPVLELLLERGANLADRDETDQTPLHVFSAVPVEEAVAMALEHGADASAVDEEGWTPLHRAASAAQAKNVKLLVAAGADRHLKNKQGRTPYEMNIAAGWPPE